MKTPEKLWAFLDVVMELDIPFVSCMCKCRCFSNNHGESQILSHACPLAVVPDDVKEKVKVYGKGVMSAWTPQQLISDHPVSAMFYKLPSEVTYYLV